METQTKKAELLDWLENVNDWETLLQIDAIKNGEKKFFDFDAEWEKGMTGEEFKAEMSKRIKAYPWKK